MNLTPKCETGQTEMEGLVDGDAAAYALPCHAMPYLAALFATAVSHTRSIDNIITIITVIITVLGLQLLDCFMRPPHQRLPATAAARATKD